MKDIKFRVYDRWSGEYTNYQLTDNLLFALDKDKRNGAGWKRVKDDSRFIVQQYTGLTDKNGTKIFEGDIVKFLSMTGVVDYAWGSYLIVFSKMIDWEKVESEIKPYTGCDNMGCFCFNDNAISLWEICWNFNEENDCTGVVEVIGNIYENPELLEGAKG